MDRIVKLWSANKCHFERKSSKLHRYLLTGAIVFAANVAESVDRERTKKWLSITVTHEQTKGPMDVGASDDTNLYLSKLPQDSR